MATLLFTVPKPGLTVRPLTVWVWVPVVEKLNVPQPPTTKAELELSAPAAHGQGAAQNRGVARIGVGAGENPFAQAALGDA